jgi:hypothetical protein
MPNLGEECMQQSLYESVISYYSKHITRWCVSIHANGNNQVAICEDAIGLMGEGL